MRFLASTGLFRTEHPAEGAHSRVDPPACSKSPTGLYLQRGEEAGLESSPKNQRADSRRLSALVFYVGPNR